MKNWTINAEESAAAAEELNAQAETMKQSVTELMQLVGGQGQNPGSAVPAKPVSKVHMSAPPNKRNGSTNGNGHAVAAPVLAGTNGGRGNSLDDVFKDF